MATRWFELGLVLLDRKYQNELTIIEEDTKNDAIKCCRKMFSKWLDTDELACWDDLIKAAKNARLNNVANDIEQLLLHGEYVRPSLLLVTRPYVQLNRDGREVIF